MLRSPLSLAKTSYDAATSTVIRIIDAGHAETFEAVRFQVEGFLAGVAERDEQPGRGGLERLRGERLERVLGAAFCLEIAHLRGAATC